MNPVKPARGRQRRLDRSNYNELIHQHNCLTRFLGSVDANTQRAMQICGTTLKTGRLSLHDPTLDAFYSETTDKNKVKVYAGYVGKSGHFGPTLVGEGGVTLTVDVTGFGWVQVGKAGGSPTITYGATMPDLSSSSFFVWRIFSAAVTGGVASITGRSTGDKYAHSAIGSA